MKNCTFLVRSGCRREKKRKAKQSDEMKRENEDEDEGDTINRKVRMTSLLPFGVDRQQTRGRTEVVLGPGDCSLGSSRGLYSIPVQKKKRHPMRLVASPRPFQQLPYELPQRQILESGTNPRGHWFCGLHLTQQLVLQVGCRDWRRRRDLSQLHGAEREVITTPTSQCATERLTTRRGKARRGESIRGRATPSSFPPVSPRRAAPGLQPTSPTLSPIRGSKLQTGIGVRYHPHPRSRFDTVRLCVSCAQPDPATSSLLLTAPLHP